MKKCTKCGKLKPRNKYRDRKEASDGLQYWCKDCENRANKKRYVPKPKRPRVKKDPKVVKRNARDRSLNHRYGISLEIYNDMYNKQNGKCLICLKKYPNGGVKGLYVDHCHDTGNVRGLLCPKCNSLLGKFMDDKEMLNRAIIHLERGESN